MTPDATNLTRILLRQGSVDRKRWNQCCHCSSALLVQAISSTTAPTHIAELALKTKKIFSKSGQGLVMMESGHCTANHVCSVHSETAFCDIHGSHRARYEDYHLQCSVGYSQTFQRDMHFPYLVKKISTPQHLIPESNNHNSQTLT